MEEHHSAVEQYSLFEELGSPPSEEKKKTRMGSSKNSNFIHLFNTKQNRVM
jgi:hypothetical protein